MLANSSISQVAFAPIEDLFPNRCTFTAVLFRSGQPKKFQMPVVYAVLYVLIIGFCAGVLAGIVIPTNLDLVSATITGIVGAGIGLYFFPEIGANVTVNTVAASLITATVGAIALLIVVHLFHFLMGLDRRSR